MQEIYVFLDPNTREIIHAVDEKEEADDLLEYTPISVICEIWEVTNEGDKIRVISEYAKIIFKDEMN